MSSIYITFRDGSMQRTTECVGSAAEKKYHKVRFTCGSLQCVNKHYFISKGDYEYWCTYHRATTEKKGAFRLLLGTYGRGAHGSEGVAVETDKNDVRYNTDSSLYF